jgi:ABC-type Fe3+/spermidine/putrescine transport system ATPase subunit
MSLLEVCCLCKSYPDGWMLQDVSFAVGESETLCLLGPSGCGKTTLLRLLAGLETPDEGQILLDGEDITLAPSHLRGFGLMFQEYALFPHKDVFGNVAFGLRMQGLSREMISSRVTEVLGLVGLTGFEHRDVNRLSGGERQRVALARSLAPQPRLLMLDEPLGALDRTLRERLMNELPDILRQAGVATITVTHDQEEAFALADRVVLMRDGRVVQIGTPEEVYRCPTSVWSAQFLGLTNLLDASLVGRQVRTKIGILQVNEVQSAAWGSESAMQVLIRPEAARMDNSGPNTLRAIVTERTFRGERYRLGVRHASGVELSLKFPTRLELPAPGEFVTLSLDPQALMLLASD